MHGSRTLAVAALLGAVAATRAGAQAMPARQGGVRFSQAGTTQLTARQFMSLTVFAGYGGTFRAGHWTPIEVVVDAKIPQEMVEFAGESVRGTLEISFDTGARTQETHQVRIEVPVLGQRRYRFLILPEGNTVRVHYEPDFGEGIRARLSQSSVTDTFGPITGVVRMADAPGGARLVGALRRNHASLRRVGSAPAQQQLEVAGMGPTDLPGTAEGLFGLDALALSLEELAGLSPQLQDSLLVWVRSGGHVVLTYDGPFAQLPRPWEAALPATLSLGRQVVADAELDALGPDPLPMASRVFVAVDQLSPRGAVLLHVGGVPLVTRQRVGSGTVTLVGASLAAPPFREWSGLPAMWDLALPAHPQMDSGQLALRDALATAFLGFRDISATGLSTILVLFAVYAGAIGGGLAWVMRRGGWIQWYWATASGVVGLLAFVMTFSNVMATFSLERAVVRTVTILRMRSGADTGRLETFAVGTALADTSVPLTVGVASSGVRVLPPRRGLTAAEQHFRIVHERYPTVDAVPVGPAAATVLLGTDAAANAPALEFVRIAPGAFRVRNRTGSRLMHAGIALADGYLPLQSIADGQELNVEPATDSRFLTWAQYAQIRQLTVILPGLVARTQAMDIAGEVSKLLETAQGARWLGAARTEPTLFAWYPLAGVAAGADRELPFHYGQTLLVVLPEGR